MSVVRIRCCDPVDSISHIDSIEIFSENCFFRIVKFEETRVETFSHFLYNIAFGIWKVLILDILFGDCRATTNVRSGVPVFSNRSEFPDNINTRVFIKSMILDRDNRSNEFRIESTSIRFAISSW